MLMLDDCYIEIYRGKSEHSLVCKHKEHVVGNTHQ